MLNWTRFFLLLSSAIFAGRLLLDEVLVGVAGVGRVVLGGPRQVAEVRPRHGVLDKLVHADPVEPFVLAGDDALDRLLFLLDIVVGGGVILLLLGEIVHDRLALLHGVLDLARADCRCSKA